MRGGVLKVCVVSEGCYPYVVGGVSSWIHSIIQLFPNLEFILVNIVSDREQRGKFVYDLPGNVTKVYEVYLQDVDWCRSPGKKKRRFRLKKNERKALRSLMLDQDVEWDTLFHMFQEPSLSINDLLMGKDFFEIAIEVYKRRYMQIMFSDFLWTLRSMYVPLFLVMRQKVPKADLYHCVATGYAGIIGSMGVHFHRSRLLLSEHGIYTREREEELIRAKWLDNLYKNIWIEQFKKMSNLAYERADIVTSLYDRARQLQIELGCPREKARVVPNGIDAKRLERLPGKSAEEEKMVYIGAILRVTRIKDVKTLLGAFACARKEVHNLKLWIMGSLTEEAEYAEECMEFMRMLRLEDVVFTGSVDIREYLGKMDFTILTSISEGQPLTVLESYAAGKPVIATDVGSCRELIYGEKGDSFGSAGILTHIMNQQEIAQAMIELARNPEKRTEMGRCGYYRMKANYEIGKMQNAYRNLYRELCEDQYLTWQEEDFVMERT